MNQVQSKETKNQDQSLTRVLVHLSKEDEKPQIYWVKYAEIITEKIGQTLDKIVHSRMYTHLGCLKDKKIVFMSLCVNCRKVDLFIVPQRKGTLDPIKLFFSFKWRIFLGRLVRLKLIQGSFPILPEIEERVVEIEKDNRSTFKYQPNYAKDWYNIGVTLHEKKKYKQAEKAYRRSIKYQPNFTLPWYNLGLLLLNKKKYIKAENACQEVIKHEPCHALAWNNLGVALVNQGYDKRAEEAYRKAIEYDPKVATAYYNLGNRLVNQGQEEDGEEAYRIAINLNPTYSKVWLYLGRLLVKQKREEEAEEAYRRAIEHKPRYGEAWKDLRKLLARQRREEEAEEVRQKMLEIISSDPLHRKLIPYIVTKLKG